jgi:MFS family permease
MLSKRQLAQPLSNAVVPLQSVDYRRLLAANFIWWFTIFMEFVAFGWLVLDLTDSVWMVAVVGFFRSLPLLLFGSFGGAITDRFGRRPVILAAQTTSLLVYLSLSLLMFSGLLVLWQLPIAAFLLGAAWSVDWPSRRALLPDLVGKQLTVDAMLLENFAQGWARILGPWTGGVLLAVAGPAGCFGVMAAGAGAGLFILRQLSNAPIPRTTMRPSASPWTVLGESLRYARNSQPILGVLLITVIFNLFIIPYMTLLPVFARDILGRGPVGLGMLGAAAGIGSFIGLIVINRLRRTYSNGWILLAGTFGMCITLFIFGRSEVYLLSWFMLLLTGMGQACFGIMQSSIILLSASDDMRQRTMGLVVLAIGADPFGKLQTGALAQVFGAPAAVSLQATVAGVCIAAVGIALPGLRQQRPRPAAPAPAK